MRTFSAEGTKKADVAEHPEVFDHVGLLVNEPSSLRWGALHLVIRQHAHRYQFRVHRVANIIMIRLETAKTRGFVFGAINKQTRIASHNRSGSEPSRCPTRIDRSSQSPRSGSCCQVHA